MRCSALTILVVLPVLLAAVQLAEGSCSDNFKVYREIGNNLTTEEIKDVCLEEFSNLASTSSDQYFDCTGFQASFNRSLLPPGFEQSAYSVNKPSSVKLDPLQTEYFNTHNNVLYLYPGLRITWDSPQSEISKSNLEGFIFFFEPLDKYQNRYNCRLFLFNNSKLQVGGQWPKLTFSYTIKIVPTNETIRTRVYSVPTPKPQEEDQDLYKEAEMKTTFAFDKSSGPARWVPTVSLQARSDGRLDLGISLSPEKYNLTRFELKLVKMSYSNLNPWDSAIFDTQVMSPDKTTGHFEFTNLEADQYYVVVRPVDTIGGSDPSKCLCWEKDTSDVGKHCMNTCNSIQTLWVNVTDGWVNTTDENKGSTISSIVGTQSTPTGGVSSKPVSSNSQTMSDAGLTALITLSFIFVLLLLTLLVFCLYRRSSFVKAHIDQLLSLCQHKEKYPLAWPPSPLGSPHIQGSQGSQGSPKTVGSRTVYLMYSEDHPAQIKLLDALASFLNVHCSCNVIYRRWSSQTDQGGLAWVVSSISACDLVMFVATEGAERLVEAHLSNKMYRGRAVPAEGDLFLLGVQRLLSEGSGVTPVERVVPVTFSTQRWCQKQLLFPVMYQLPQHLPDMLMKIHRLSPSHALTLSSKLPLSVETLPELSQGADLLEAVTEVQRYESDHPSWFSDMFGEATPVITPLASISHISTSDSDYGSLSPGQSVSSQDVNTSDYIGSPASVFGGPDFSSYLNRNFSTRSNPDTHSASWNHFVRGPGGGSQRQGRPREGVPGVFSISSETEAPYEICPPDTPSDIGSDVMSDAFRNFNSRNEWAAQPDSYNHQVVKPPVNLQSDQLSQFSEAYTLFNPNSIIPPQPVSDVSSDIVSLALRKVNAASGNGWSAEKGNHCSQVQGSEAEVKGHDLSLVEEEESINKSCSELDVKVDV